jgi:ankyrin repeat protein
LISASREGHLDIVQYLISKGADIEQTAIDDARNDKIKEILKNAKKKEILKQKTIIFFIVFFNRQSRE